MRWYDYPYHEWDKAVWKSIKKKEGDLNAEDENRISR